MSVAAIHREPGLVPSGILAFVVHLGFFALLFFGVHWQTRVTEPIVVDVWEDIPDVKEPSPEPPPPPRPQPKAEPKPPPPPPKVEQPSQADIALKEKRELERQRKAEDAARKKEEDRLRKEAELEDKRQREQEVRRLEEEKRLQDAARKRDEAMLENLIAQEEKRTREAEAQRRRASELQQARLRVLEEHIGRVRAKIQSKVVVPPGMQGNPEAHYSVTVLPGGDVLEIRLVRSSGVPLYDQAVERAIRAAEPLPVPSQPELFQQMRELNLKFRPLE